MEWKDPQPEDDADCKVKELPDRPNGLFEGGGEIELIPIGPRTTCPNGPRGGGMGIDPLGI